MATAFEDAGFEIRDQLMWVFGSGFPKSHNIGKAIDKIEGNEREVVGKVERKDFTNYEASMMNVENREGSNINTILPVTKGNSDWEGWGTALKPAHEPIVMARKPLSEKSIAENVLKHGTGGINIDGSRIGSEDGKSKVIETLDRKQSTNGWNTKYVITDDEPRGRFPANIIFDEEAGQLLDEQSGNSGGGSGKKYPPQYEDKTHGLGVRKTLQVSSFNDKGGASRFFYCPKAAKKDRDEGMDGFDEKIVMLDGKEGRTTGLNTPGHQKPSIRKNIHPTVKPTDLMRYLINLITPPNGTILDPFMGSGSTGKAAVRCGVNFIGIEKEQEYMDIAKARIEHERNKPVQTKLL
jgi:site-specific DNA-methyltransferase (adenine-specific)